MMVHAMSSINVINMDYSVNMFLRQYWNDTRLAYLHRGYNQSLTLNSKKSELWVPDLYFINEKEGSFHEITTPNLLLRVKPLGQVTFSQKITVKLSCNMDLKKFPMDQQKCHVKMESYGYTTEELMFEWVAKVEERVQFSDDLQLPEFETPPNISTETRVVQYLTGKYSYLIATFYLNRKSGFYLIQTYIPSILIVILSWVSFWIDVKAVPARISLGLLTVLSMTTQSSGALGQLPRAIDVWMSTCLVFVFGALIEYAIANVLSRQQSALEHWEELRAILDSQRNAARNGAVPANQVGEVVVDQVAEVVVDQVGEVVVD
uniref:Neur_chan_LBD domain-containing protein n=2 Tax=Macrostomum lignano TaxID=282301 RepID=A0A1I8J585_9PLAT